MFPFFTEIIAPYSTETFFDVYHEKNILHIARNNKNYYDKILSVTEISTFLERQDIFYPSLRVVKNGKEIPSAEYTLKATPIGHHKKDGIINTEKVFTLFNTGATLVIQGGQRYFNKLSKCCVALSQNFHSPIQANLYITPDKSQGFNPHWDTHDVFVLQISGTKTWHLYGFDKELPTKNQTFVNKGYNKQPQQSLEIHPGDFLYIPRGYVHDAVADNGISAHITIGILSFTWARFFTELMLQLENEKIFREAIPLWNKNLPDLIQKKIETLKSTIDILDTSKTLQQLNTQHLKMQAQPVDNYFQSLLHISEVNNDSLFLLNDGIIYSYTENDNAVLLQYLGKTIALPLTQKKNMDYILKNKTFMFSQLQGENKEEFIRLLIKEGFISIVKI